MGEQSDNNHPIITRWRVAKVADDTMVAEGDVRGAITASGRTVGTGLITGTRHMTAVSGMLSMQTSTVNLETLMVAAEGATRVTRGIGTTSLEIVVIPGARVTP
jgi:acetyl-CoA carboxylase carboxyltransferase component